MAYRPETRALRLSFRMSDGRVELVGAAREDGICPPPPAETPDARTHGGFWFEVHDGEGNALFHRVVDDPFTDSVEEFHPDGSIRRHVAPATEKTFEVLVADDPRAAAVVLVGERRAGDAKQRRTKAGAVGVIARFPLGGER